MLTLFTVLTLEGWNEVLFSAQDVTRFAWIFFVSFVLIGAFLVINVLIAIIINAIEEAREAEKVEQMEERLSLAAAEGEEPDRVASLIDRVRGLRSSLADLELELEGLDLQAAEDRSDPEPPIR
jgi:voltage-gated sodium channel